MSYYHFFRYDQAVEGLRNRLIEVIANSSLYFSDWTKFNDPGEGSFMINKSPRSDLGSSNAHCRIIDSKMRLSVLCSTSEFDNCLHWSLYADGHRGLCLEFEILPDTGIEIIAVKYRSQAPVITLPDLGDEVALQDVAKRILSYKHKDMISEKEIRHLIRSGPGYQKVAIKSIGLGLGLKHDDKNRITKMLNDYGVEYYLMCRKRGQYRPVVCSKRMQCDK